MCDGHSRFLENLQCDVGELIICGLRLNDCCLSAGAIGRNIERIAIITSDTVVHRRCARSVRAIVDNDYYRRCHNTGRRVDFIWRPGPVAAICTHVAISYT